MKARTTLIAAVTALAGAPDAARAAITLAPGPNTVATSKLELDFGDGSGNVERLDALRWRDSAGTQTANLVSAGGTASAACGSDVLETWGQSYGNTNVFPITVAAGAAGTWA